MARLRKERDQAIEKAANYEMDKQVTEKERDEAQSIATLLTETLRLCSDEMSLEGMNTDYVTKALSATPANVQRFLDEEQRKAKKELLDELVDLKLAISEQDYLKQLQRLSQWVSDKSAALRRGESKEKS